MLAPWLTGHRRPLAAAAVAVACAILFLVPTALGARDTAFKRTYTNQVAAIYGLCAQIPADASVVIIDGPMADRWGEAVRGMCDVPVARFPANANGEPEAPVALVRNAIASIERTGRRPVLLAGSQKELAPFASDGTITHVVNAPTTEDGKSFLSKPYSISEHDNLTAWMSRSRPADHMP